MSAWQQVLDYHERTKHAPGRFARSPGYLDWATQPDPFRRFEGAPLVSLALRTSDAGPAYDDLFSPGAIAPDPVDLTSLSALFEYSLGLSAWKQLGPSRWALRMNPSSGNLHPTEGYLVVGPVDGLTEGGGIYHYAPKEHAIERRTSLAGDVWQQLVSGFPVGTFFVGLSSIHWREAWKYGERAFRYCQHDVGHALAAVSISAALLGWQAFSMDGLSDNDIATLLGLDRSIDFQGAEREHPDLLLAVVTAPSARSQVPACLPPDPLAAIAASSWTGAVNSLSSDHVDWEIIDAVADATRKPAEPDRSLDAEFSEFEQSLECDRRDLQAGVIIRQRRSAVAMDGETAITAPQFFRMLERTLPRHAVAPWSAVGPPACVHLVLFVHLIEGLESGLYCLVRSPQARERLAASMRSDFAWKVPPSCPDSLPLFLLAAGDCRALAWKVSCDQQIAGASAFSLGMLAEFEPRLRERGAWLYRRLFWETGAIGQMLYLEAEAAGVRGTGIGCFFDDAVHEVLGLSGKEYQSLYHFTIGGPVEDTRLTTIEPYPGH